MAAASPQDALYAGFRSPSRVFQARTTTRRPPPYAMSASPAPSNNDAVAATAGPHYLRDLVRRRIVGGSFGAQFAGVAWRAGSTNAWRTCGDARLPDLA